MLFCETKIRVRYGETDLMGYVYYGNYLLYYEVGRTELMRKYDLTYRELEEKGMMLPVAEAKVEYFAPATYDTELIIKTTVKEIPSARIVFEYEIFDNELKLINKGYTTLVFVNATTRKPCRPPKQFTHKINQCFNEQT